ncbi:hypothetical protein [Salinithrix halophila]|uniref:Uncharacterized protein n=1 Tax=Salinithrix halophila TaxID=1485204 RepID=A0ABV8JFF5_9BACL
MERREIINGTVEWFDDSGSIWLYSENGKVVINVMALLRQGHGTGIKKAISPDVAQEIITELQKVVFQAKEAADQ